MTLCFVFVGVETSKLSITRSIGMDGVFHWIALFFGSVIDVCVASIICQRLSPLAFNADNNTRYHIRMSRSIVSNKHRHIDKNINFVKVARSALPVLCVLLLRSKNTSLHTNETLSPMSVSGGDKLSFATLFGGLSVRPPLLHPLLTSPLLKSQQIVFPACSMMDDKREIVIG